MSETKSARTKELKLYVVLFRYRRCDPWEFDHAGRGGLDITVYTKRKYADRRRGELARYHQRGNVKMTMFSERIAPERQQGEGSEESK